MKLSIITINYNNKSGLEQTIRSVLRQTYHDFEWIVIDGGSTDGSKELIEKYKNHFAYWISEPDRGIYHAMNKGTSKASGEYCQYLNSGDYYIHERVLESVFQQSLLGDVNYGDVHCIKNNQVTEKRIYPDKIGLTFLLRSPLGHQATFIRTSIAHKHPYKEQYSISADRAFFLELYCNDYYFQHIKQPIVYFNTEGIGSRIETLEIRREQFDNIKKELFSSQVSEDIKEWMRMEDDYLFIQRVAPLRWFFLLFKRLQTWKNKL